MCGIFGALGGYDPKIVMLLTILNESRGKDSCGFYNGDIVYKGDIAARDSISSDFLRLKHNFIMGHARYATHGKVTRDNAHPFKYGKIVGAHNGVVSNFRALREKHEAKILKTHKSIFDMEVDSQVIFWGLDQFGVEFLKEVEAYWGLWWYNENEPHIINLSVPTHELALARDKDAIYCSSDIEDLKRLGFKGFQLKHDHVYRIDTNTLEIRKFKLKGLHQGFTKKDWRTQKAATVYDYGYNYDRVGWGEAAEISESIREKMWETRHEKPRPVQGSLSASEMQELIVLELRDAEGEHLTPEEEQRYLILSQRADDAEDKKFLLDFRGAS